MNVYAQRVLGANAERRGAAIVMVMLALLGLFGVSLALWTTSLSARAEQRGALAQLSAEYAAEAGISAAFAELQANPDSAQAGVIGSAEQPNTFGGSNFWVSRQDGGAGVTSFTATGVGENRAASIELVVERAIDAFYVWGAFGDDFLQMSSNARVDSYDSRLGTYASQAVNGSGSSSYASTDGDVGSNGSVTMVQNAKVHGDVTPGENSTAIVLGNAVVTGSTAPATEAYELPELVVPSFGTLGNYALGNGSNQTIASGDVEYTNLTVGKQATLTIVGPARVVVSNFSLLAGGSVVVDASNGPVELYVKNDFVMNSNTSIASTTFAPKDVKVFLESDNIINPNLVVELDEIGFESNSKLYGTIYAPRAMVDIRSNFELFGSLVAKRVNLSSNSLVHFDEALMFEDESGDVQFQVVGWVRRATQL